MTEPYLQHYRARWSDMDFNQHMRNAAYLGCGEETRMRYLDAHGWTMAEFMKRKLGPVVLEDKLTYKKELKLLEPFRVDLALAACTEDGRRMKVRNRFFREADDALCAVVDSVVLWFDLVERKPVIPPDELRQLWFALARTEDFEPW
jgi:acyl-CoA thioester hydrolase